MTTKEYRKHRNIIRNNVPKDFSKGIAAGTFAGHCLVQRFNQFLKTKKVIR